MPLTLFQNQTLDLSRLEKTRNHVERLLKFAELFIIGCSDAPKIKVPSNSFSDRYNEEPWKAKQDLPIHRRRIGLPDPGKVLF